MSRCIALALCLFTGLLFWPSEASARWRCKASSPTGSWGWGSHNYSERYARQRALWECARRTPRGYTCRLNNCTFTGRGYR